MKNILVLGGTRFFGKKAVELLLEKDYNVTIATRGNTPHPFGDKVDHIILDASDANHAGWAEVGLHKWDAVFNNVLYTKEDASLMIDKFSELTDQFYFTSSMAVYSGAKDGYAEEDFDPVHYEMDKEKAIDYGEGKRQAETILYTKAPFKVTAFRFPIVLDTDDYTERLHFYIEKALKQEPIHFNNLDSKVNYVKGTTAAESILWAIENEKSGIYNISSIDAVSLRELMEWIEATVNQPLLITEEKELSERSPFNTPHDQYLISQKIHNEGFPLSGLESWMKPLIKDLKAQLEME